MLRWIKVMLLTLGIVLVSILIFLAIPVLMTALSFLSVVAIVGFIAIGIKAGLDMENKEGS